MKTIKLTDKEHKIICQILGNLQDQIDQEICELPSVDDNDEEYDRILDEARNAFAKLY